MKHPSHKRAFALTSALVAAALAGTALQLSAQGGSQSEPRFEVASVKTNKSGQTNGMLRRQPGGRLEATNMPLRMLITFAYQLQPYRLVGGPDWITTERFDIVAKFDGDPPPSLPGGPPDPIALSMRALLGERFHLKLRQEQRDMDVYNLVLARADGKPGPALKPTAQDCSPDAVRARLGGGPPAPPNPSAPVPALPFCGVQISGGRMRVGGMPLSMFTNTLSGQVGRTVLDHTGLDGGWDFELTFAPTGLRPAGAAPADAPSADPDAPSIFTALQEQLGLKLDSGKAPTDVYVIENVERPVDD